MLELALLVPLSIVEPNRRQGEPVWQRFGAVALIALVNVANMVSLVLLVHDLLQGKANGKPITGTPLLVSRRC